MKGFVMKTRITLCLVAVALILIAGCTADQVAKVQRDASLVQGATTQPLAQAAASTTPYGNAVLSIVSLLAGAVVAAAPLFVKNTSLSTANASLGSENANLKTAVVETTGDTAASLSDAAFSAPTTAILTALGVDTPGSVKAQATAAGASAPVFIAAASPAKA